MTSLMAVLICSSARFKRKLERSLLSAETNLDIVSFLRSYNHVLNCVQNELNEKFGTGLNIADREWNNGQGKTNICCSFQATAYVNSEASPLIMIKENFRKNKDLETILQSHPAQHRKSLRMNIGYIKYSQKNAILRLFAKSDSNKTWPIKIMITWDKEPKKMTEETSI